MKSEQLRSSILRTLLEIAHSGRSSPPDELELAAKCGADVGDICDQLDILESQGAIQSNQTLGNHYFPMLTGRGKYVLEQMESHQGVPSNVQVDARARVAQTLTEYEWDVFISHASEDKDDFVRPLAESLRRQGLRVWFDEFTLRAGDSLRRSIDAGLAGSAYGVVVLSPAFFSKNWPQQELDGLWARTRDEKKVILPVWKDVTRDDVASRSLMLADLVALMAQDGVDPVSQGILDVVMRPPAGSKSSSASQPHASGMNWIDRHFQATGQLPRLPDCLLGLALDYKRGAPISKTLRLRPLGAQTWHKMQPDERGQLRELVEWLGMSWADYWEHSSRLWPRSWKPPAPR